MSENSIAFIFACPLFGAILCTLLGRTKRHLCHPVTLVSLSGALWGGIETLRRAVASEANEVSYLLGGWTLDAFPRGVGIEFRADLLGTLIMLVVVGVAFLVALYSKLPVAEETPEKEGPFYTLFLLQVTGLAGICLTGDVFNLYVLIEDTVSSRGGPPGPPRPLSITLYWALSEPLSTCLEWVTSTSRRAPSTWSAYRR
jgi:multicomponent Na+:H+ antiporter subunit D